MGKEISSSRVHMSTARQFYESVKGQEALVNIGNERKTTRVQMSNANESIKGQEALVNVGNERNTTIVQMSNANESIKGQ